MDLEAYTPSYLTLSMLCTLLATYLLLIHLSTQKWHGAEPPIVSCPLLFPIPLPYVGHLLGMALQGGHYIKQLGLSTASTTKDKKPLPVFTLVVPFSRLYIVTSPTLANVVQRKSTRELSFNKILPELTGRIMGLDEDTKEIVKRGLLTPAVVKGDGEFGPAANSGGESGFLVDLHHMIVSYLGPGTVLDELTLTAVRELIKELDTYSSTVLNNNNNHNEEETPSQGKEEELLPWLRDVVAQSAARMLYGDRNPFVTQPHPEQHDLEKGMWDFDHGLGRLLMGIWPTVTAPKAYHGREKMVAAFREYLVQKHYEPAMDGKSKGASQIIHNRLRICSKHGFSVDATARSETSFLFAGIVNTATVAFWSVLRIFADGPEGQLLRDVREELARCEAIFPAETMSGGVDTGNEQKQQQLLLQLSIGKLVKNNFAACPKLHAVCREVLRMGSNNVGARLVLGGGGNEIDNKDGEKGRAQAQAQAQEYVHIATSQDGEYLLRKGSIIQIAGGVMHNDKTIWGEDADEFNPQRHVLLSRSSTATSTSTTNKTGTGTGTTMHPGAWRPFGGGNTRCPGQHLAKAEIIALVACIVLRFDIEGVSSSSQGDSNRGKEIKVPELDDYIMPVHILEPVAGDPVRVRIRLRDNEKRSVRVVA